MWWDCKSQEDLVRDYKSGLTYKKYFSLVVIAYLKPMDKYKVSFVIDKYLQSTKHSKCGGITNPWKFSPGLQIRKLLWLRNISHWW